MIKYITFDAQDEYGRHVIPANMSLSLVKTASSQSYSEPVKSYLDSMKRESGLYYAVINAMGTHEAWGYNKRGDSFPGVGLKNVSLQSDMGTDNDYGYKTFEYYAKLYRHHVNKDPKKSFGPVLFSYFNPENQRVELVVGISYETAKDLIDKIENGEDFAVSMGCRVRYDRCSICGNKAKTRAQYCKHLKDYMKVIVDEELARQWSQELGYTVMPGSAVFAYNDHPKFFDISYVDAGADSTAFVLGKAASGIDGPNSAMEGEASGITDADLDKLAAIGKSGTIQKKSEIDKVIGPTDSLDCDAKMVPATQRDYVKRLVKEKLSAMASREKNIPNPVLDDATERFGHADVLQTMIRSGIVPRPAEVQRIVLIGMHQPEMAQVMSDNNACFDYSREVEPQFLSPSYNDGVLLALKDYLDRRSCHPAMLIRRISEFMSKQAGILPNDYWFEQSPHSGSLILQSDGPHNDPRNLLSAIAAIYAGLKLQVSGLPVGNAIEVFAKRPWLGTMIAGGTYQDLLNRIKNSDGIQSILTPSYRDVDLDNAPLFKSASDNEMTWLEDYMFNPSHYIMSSQQVKPVGFIKAAGLNVSAMNPKQLRVKQLLMS